MTLRRSQAPISSKNKVVTLEQYADKGVITTTQLIALKYAASRRWQVLVTGNGAGR